MTGGAGGGTMGLGGAAGGWGAGGGAGGGGTEAALGALERIGSSGGIGACRLCTIGAVLTAGNKGPAAGRFSGPTAASGWTRTIFNSGTAARRSYHGALRPGIPAPESPKRKASIRPWINSEISSACENLRRKRDRRRRGRFFWGALMLRPADGLRCNANCISRDFATALSPGAVRRASSPILQPGIKTQE